MRVVFISDTHNQMDQVLLPDGDLLIHCGDATNGGSFEEIYRFNYDLSEAKEKYRLGIVYIAGNHDKMFQRERGLANATLTRARYLEDQLIEIEGLRIYGSPWTRRYFDWSFMREDHELVKYWDNIPENLDILITHGPPKGMLDQTYHGDLAGSVTLRAAVEQKRPRVHAFGHIHFDHGIQWEPYPYTLFINAATCGEHYKPTNPPIVIDIDSESLSVPGANWSVQKGVAYGGK